MQISLTDRALEGELIEMVAVARTLDFDSIFREERDYVFWLVGYLGVATADVEDVVHDVFVAFWTGRSRFNPALPIRPWLAGISDRRIRKYRCRPWRRREIVGEPLDTVDPAPSPLDQCIDRQQRAILRWGLGRISYKYRVVIVLHCLGEEKLGAPEIARALDIPLNTVYSRLRVGLEKLGAAIQEKRSKEKPLNRDEPSPELAQMFKVGSVVPPASSEAVARVYARIRTSIGANGGGTAGASLASRGMLTLPRLVIVIGVATASAIGGYFHIRARSRHVSPQAPIRPPTTAEAAPSTVEIRMPQPAVPDVRTPPEASSGLPATGHALPSTVEIPLRQPAPPYAGPPAASADSAKKRPERKRPQVPASHEERPAGERLLLEEAQGCLANEDTRCARIALGKHERWFANGTLIEEREALWIRVLEAAGDALGAEDRARRFLARFPASVYAEAARRAVEGDALADDEFQALPFPGK